LTNNTEARHHIDRCHLAKVLELLVERSEVYIKGKAGKEFGRHQGGKNNL
jgi:hypothetical protein